MIIIMYVKQVMIVCIFFSVEMNYEMLAEIDDEIGDLHILDTANTVRIENNFHVPRAFAST